jgi:subtilisin family serine protease
MARKKRSSSSAKRAAATKKVTKGRRAKAPAGSGSALSALLANLPSVDVMRRLAEVLPAPGSPQAPPFALAAPRVERPPVTLEMLGTRLSEVAPEAGAKLQELPVKISTSMDPRLQLALANQRTGKRSLALASTGGGEIAVVARVKSVDEWKVLPDVFHAADLGKVEGSSIVTGRIPIQQIETVRKQSTVISLKASQPVGPHLASTIPVMGVGPGALPPGKSPDGGSRSVIGFVDFGCDFAHRNFVLANGKTRLLALWDQAGVAKPDSPFGYGRLHLRDEIDAALATPDPYGALGYAPPPDTFFEVGTHGTHVMDIAAGNGGGSNQPGVAPKADLIFVEASISDIPWTGPESVNKRFGDSVQMLEAVRFIFDTAGDRPCVCNLSLGTNSGPHDGTSLVEQGLDALVREKPNRAVVIAASNSQLDNIHTSGQVPATGTHDIVWRQQNSGGGEFELWYPGARRLAVTLIAPDGTNFGPVQPGNNLPVGLQGTIAIFISNRLTDPNNQDNVIGIWLANGLSPNDFTIRLQSTDGNAVDYHAWIERNDPAQASFAQPVPTHTLGSISTGQDSIVVGSYDAHKPPPFPLSSFSSCGPTRDGRNKPEVSAPGQNVVAARSRTLTGVTRKSGTSMAAPAVTGLIALIFSEAQRNNQNLDIAAVRTKLTTGVLRNPPAGAAGVWDPFYGTGRASGNSV